MRLKKLIQPGLSINTYLLIDETTHLAVVVDPIRVITPVVEVLQLENAKLIYILETHVHADFVSGAKELKHYFNEAPQILCSAEGGKEWVPSYADVLVHDQEIIEIGTLKLQAWHVPGHTPEHLMWVVFDTAQAATHPVLAFTGDFLLTDSLGRPDLLGDAQTHGLAEKLYHSVFQTLHQFPDTLQILPAHGAGSFCGKGISEKNESTLGEEKQSNPYLRKLDKAMWIEQLLFEIPSAPSYFKRLKQLNVKGSPLKHAVPLVEAKEVQAELLIDIRNPEEFAKSHLRGSLNIPYGPLFAKWAGELLPDNQSILLIGTTLDSIQQAAADLHLLGLDELKGYVFWDKLPKEKLTSFELAAPQAVDRDKPFVIDVRTHEEWDEGHIPGAVHMPLPTLSQELAKIPKDQKIVLTCGRGYRSSIAASLLEKNGFPHVASLKGGMQAWRNAQLNVELGFWTKVKFF